MGNMNILGCEKSNNNNIEDENKKKRSKKAEKPEIKNIIKIGKDIEEEEKIIKRASDTTLRRGVVLASKKNLPVIKPGSIIPVSIDKAILIGEGNTNIFEKYEFSDNEKDKLGEGTFGSVIKAKHKLTNELVAIKIIPKSNFLKNDDLKKEAEILKELDHPNIIKIFELYDTESDFYIVQELCNGGDLFSKIKDEGGQSEITTGIIIFQILSAVNYLHQRNLMHRDLKLENILLENSQYSNNIYVKIIDFGTAKFYSNNKEKEITGTPFYIAPEVLNGNYSEKCDAWSIGVIIYAILSGKLPFGGSNKLEVFTNIKNANYDLKMYPFNVVSKEIKDLIQKLLIKNPDERLSVKNALEHDFFKKFKIKEKLSKLSTDKLKILLNNIKNYNPELVLQQTTIAYLVHNYPQLSYVNEASSLFYKLDYNNDGVISKSEFINGLKDLFKEQNVNIDEFFLEKEYNFLDTDHSNAIDYEEFLRAAVDKKIFLEEKFMKFAFEYFDIDKNGQITFQEIRNLFKDSSGFPEEEFNKCLEDIDSDKDGQINYEEFCCMMKNILG